uniref:Uncharacterized protein n=1 Tax=Mimivirus LCMiAC01 TaxID=2506608 RepID=A0A481YYW3_9VIRU|nr:MAG: hypothetical protein LCMiAC01_01290 [Mimivirus LCMiAC01]
MSIVIFCCVCLGDTFLFIGMVGGGTYLNNVTLSIGAGGGCIYLGDTFLSIGVGGSCIYLGDTFLSIGVDGGVCGISGCVDGGTLSSTSKVNTDGALTQNTILIKRTNFCT